MYCINCGVKLADHETKCPLCGTRVTNPEFIKPEIPSPFPKQTETHSEMNRSGILLVLSFVFLIPIILCILCDISINSAVTWSGFAVGGIIVAYTAVVLPLWFKKPNPVIFVPSDFAAIILFLLYINLATNGKWFLSFAFPVVLMIGIAVSAAITLLKYVKAGDLYIFGGFFISLGIISVVSEILMNTTFGRTAALRWSVYPLTVFTLLGLMLIIIAICPPIRESLKKKFFI